MATTGTSELHRYFTITLVISNSCRILLEVNFHWRGYQIISARVPYGYASTARFIDNEGSTKTDVQQHHRIHAKHKW